MKNKKCQGLAISLFVAWTLLLDVTGVGQDLLDRSFISVGFLSQRVVMVPEYCDFKDNQLSCKSLGEVFREAKPFKFSFETLINFTIGSFLGFPQDFIKGSTIMATPGSGWEFQSLHIDLPFSELFALRTTVIFAPHVREFDLDGNVQREIGALIDPIRFRKFIQEVDFGVTGFLSTFKLILADFSTPQSPSLTLESGYVIDFSSQTIGGIEVSSTTYFGATEGFEIFGKGERKEESFPDIVLDGANFAGVNFVKEILSISNVTISNLTIQVDAEWVPTGFKGFNFNLDSNYELFGVKLRTRFAFTLSDLIKFVPSKLIIRNQMDLTPDITLSTLLVDTDFRPDDMSSPVGLLEPFEIKGFVLGIGLGEFHFDLGLTFEGPQDPGKPQDRGFEMIAEKETIDDSGRALLFRIDTTFGQRTLGGPYELDNIGFVIRIKLEKPVITFFSITGFGARGGMFQQFQFDWEF